jgi:CRP/FNR family transcriptional regulator, cyclic AMP receptor protein
MPAGRSRQWTPTHILESAVGAIAAAKEAILKNGWLSKTPAEFQKRVIEQCQYRMFKAGDMVFRRGELAVGMYGLASGSVSLEAAPAELGPGELAPRTNGFIAQGSWFGEVAAFMGQQRRMSVKAVRDSELLYLPSRAIHAIVAEDPATWTYFYLVTVNHVDKMISLVNDLMRREHAERFVAVLLHVCGCRHETPRRPGPFELDVGQKQLADIANVARTTAGRILRDLAKAGHIELSYRRIAIVSPDAVRSMLAV